MNGYADQREREQSGEARSPEAQADEHQPEDGQDVEEDRRRMRSRERVPFPAPLEHEHGGEVGEVGDRPIRVPALDPGLAAPVRLDALANLAVGVLRPTRLEISALRHVPVRRLAVEDPTRADDARQADVDHASRRLDVEPDAEAEEEHRRCGERPGRPDRPEGLLPVFRMPTHALRTRKYPSTG